MPSSKNKNPKQPRHQSGKKPLSNPVLQTSDERPNRDFPVWRTTSPWRSVQAYWPLVCVWVVSLAYLATRSDHGWIPHDEGLLAQTAERVLQGQLPHRDFDDPYSGGLAMLHALAFGAFGRDLYSMRIMLAGFSLASVPLMYSMTLRVASPIVAAVVTFATVVWSVPNYFASLPSWYNLYFAVFGTWSMIRFIETGRRRWLILSGAMGGLSILIKVSGIFFVAAGFVYLLFREQEQANRDKSSSERRKLLFPSASSAAAGILVVAVIVLVRQRLTTMDIALFVTPAFVLAGVVWWNEVHVRQRDDRGRWLRLVTLYVQFSLGVALPLLCFAIPYAVTASLDSVLYGNFVLPQRRMKFASNALPSPTTLISMLPLSLCFLPLRGQVRWIARCHVAAVLAVPCLMAILAGGSLLVYSGFWSSLRPMVPLFTLIGAWRVATWPVQIDEHDRWREVLFWVLSVTAMVSLVQYPFSAGIYFCYTAPMVILAGLYVAKSVTSSSGNLQLCLLLTYLAFGFFWLNNNYIQSFGNLPVFVNTNHSLELEKAGLRVAGFDVPVYRGIVRRVQLQSTPGEPIYASTDCPEIYFLCDRRNPTRTIYDFFDADFESNPEGRAERLLKMIDEQRIKVAVLRWGGEFSGPPHARLVQGLRSRFTQAEHFRFFPDDSNQSQPDFSVLWRD